jgi:hypothetical protein
MSDGEKRKIFDNLDGLWNYVYPLLNDRDRTVNIKPIHEGWEVTITAIVP